MTTDTQAHTICAQVHRRVYAHAHKEHAAHTHAMASGRDARTSEHLRLGKDRSHPHFHMHTRDLALPARGRAAYLAEHMERA